MKIELHRKKVPLKQALSERVEFVGGAGIFSWLAFLILTCFRFSVENSHFLRSLYLVMGIFATLEAGGWASSLIPDRIGYNANSTLPLDLKKSPKSQNWTDVLHSLVLVHEQHPKDPKVVGELASVLSRVGRRSESLRLLLGLAEHSSPEVRRHILRRSKVLSRGFLLNSRFELYQEGLNALEAQKYRSAQETFERILREDPENCEVLIQLGKSLILSNDVDIAIQKLNQAKKINPTDSETLYWLAKAFLARGNTKEALRELGALDPSIRHSEAGVLSLAEVQFLSGQNQQAIRLLQAHLDQNPLHVQALWWLAKMKLQGVRPDQDSLWSARKDLQLALSRLDAYVLEEKRDWELDAETRRLGKDLKPEIQKLLQQIQVRLESG